MMDDNSKADPKTIEISYNADGTISWNGESVTRDEVLARPRDVGQKEKENPTA